MLRERPPAWDGEPPEAPGRARRAARATGRARRTAASARPPVLSNFRRRAGRCRVDAPRRRRPRRRARPARRRGGRAAVVGAARRLAAAHLHRRRVDRLRPQRRRADWLALAGRGRRRRAWRRVRRRALGVRRARPRRAPRRAAGPATSCSTAARAPPSRSCGPSARTATRARSCGSRSGARAAPSGRRGASSRHPRIAPPALRRQRARRPRARVVRGPPGATNDRVEVALRRAGRSFGAPLRLATGRVRSVSVAVGPRGDVLVAWDARGKIRTRLRRARRRSFGRAETLRSSPTFSAALRTAVASSGRAYVAWAAQLAHRGRRPRPGLLRGGGAARGRRALPPRPAARAARRRTHRSACSTSR